MARVRVVPTGTNNQISVVKRKLQGLKELKVLVDAVAAVDVDEMKCSTICLMKKPKD